MTQKILGEKGKRYVGLPEFARVGARVLGEMNLEQHRGTVTTVPDERTIRFYLAESLITVPQEKQGTASVFGYLNLLQLLTVKKLQAEHLPIRKIRELVGGKSEEELETLLGVSSTTRKKTRESGASEYLNSLLATSVHPQQPAAASPMQMAESRQMIEFAGEGEQSWQRVEIEPGLELHIRSDYTPPTTSARSKNLVERIKSLISRWK